MMKKSLWLALILTLAMSLFLAAYAEGTAPTAPTVSHGTFTTGRDISVSVAKTSSGNGKIFLDVYAVDDGTETAVFHGETSSNYYSSTSFSIKGYYLQPGDYVLRAYYIASNVTSEVAEETFALEAAGQPNAPTFTLDKGAYGISETITMSVGGYSSSYTNILVQYDDGSGWKDSYNTNSYYAVNLTRSFTWTPESYPDTRNYRFRAAICQNSVWSGWTYAEAPITAYGVADNFEINGKTVYMPGEDVIAALSSSVEGMTYSYSYYLYELKEDGTTGSSKYSVPERNGDTCTWTGYSFTPGKTYRATFYATAPGYNQATKTYDFTVAEGDLTPPPADLLIVKSTIYPGQYVPFATEDYIDQLRYEYTRTGYSYTTTGTLSRSNETFNLYVNTIDEYQIRFQAHYDNLWTDWTDWLSFSVVEKPKLPDPELTLSATSLRPGTDLTVTGASSDLVNRYYLQLYRVEDGGTTYLNYANLYESSNYSTTFDGLSFLIPGDYKATVYAVPKDTQEYANSATVEVSFTVTDEAMPEAPVITFEKPVAYAGNYVYYSATLTDIDKLYYEIDYEDGTRYTSSTINASERYSRYFGQTGVYTLRFRGHANGAWTALTDDITLAVTEKPKLPDPEVTLSATMLQPGKDLTVTVGSSDFVYRYYLELYRIEDNGTTYIYSTWLYEGQNLTVMVDGLNFLTSGEYKATVYAIPKDSQEYVNSDTVEVSFTVNDEQMADPPVIVFEKPAVYAGYSAYYSATLADMDKLYYEIYREDGTKYTSSTLSARERYSFYINQVGNYILRFRGHANGAWTAFTDDITLTVIEKPSLPDPELTLSATSLRPGTDLTITVSSMELASQYYLRLYKIEDSGSTSLYSMWLYQGQDLTATVDGLRLLTSGDYKATVYATPANSDDYINSATVEVSFTVTDESMAAAPVVTFEKTVVYSGYDAYYSAVLADMDKLYYEVYTSEGSRYTYSTLDARERYSLYLWQLGDYTVRFRGHANGVWTAFTDDIALSVVEKPKLPTPQIDVPATQEGGHDLTVTFAPVEGANEYYISLYKLTEGGGSTYMTATWLYDDTTYTFSGRNLLDAGTYQVRVYAVPENSEEYANSETVTADVEVTASTVDAAVVTVENSDQLLIGDDITFSLDQAYDSIYYRSRTVGSSSYSSSQRDLDGGKSFTWSTSTAGDYEMIVTGYKDGAWTAWSEPLTFMVISLGALDEPEFTVQPSEVTAGMDIWPEITIDERVRYYNYNLRRYDEAGEYWDWVDNWNYYPEESEELRVFDGYMITAGSYRMQVTAYGRGYTSASKTVEFTVTGELADGPVVTVESGEHYIGQSVSISVSVPGADKLRVRYRHPDDDYYDGNYDYESVSGDFFFEHNFRRQGEWEIEALAHVDGAWTDWGDAVTVNIGSKGKLATPEFTSVPTELLAGSPIELAVTQVEHATNYNYGLYKKQGGSYMSYGGWGYDAYGYHVTLDSYDRPFVAGEYKVTVRVSSEEGYEESDEASVEFTITGELLPGPAVTLDKSEYTLGDSMNVVVSAPGAEAMNLRISGSGWYSTPEYNYASDKYSVWQAMNDPGKLTVKARVRVGGRWTDWGEVTTVTVTSLGQLDAPVINMDSTVEIGSGLTLSFDEVENATYYSISVRQNGYELLDRRVGRGGSYHFDDVYFDPGTYQVMIYAYGEGWESGYASKRVTFTGERAGAVPSVTCSATEIIRKAGEEPSVTFEVIASGATRARVRHDNWRMNTVYLMNNGRAVITNYDLWETGVHSYRFSVMRDGQWTPWSEPVQITVKSEGGSSGRPGTPQFTLSSDSIQIGESLTVTVEPQTDADYLNVNLISVQDETSVDGAGFEASQGGSVTFDEAVFEPGAYYVEVYAEGADGGSSASKTLTVTGQRDPLPAPVITPESDTVMVGDNLRFALSTELDASDIDYVVVKFKDWDGYYQDADFRMEDGSPVIYVSFGDQRIGRQSVSVRMRVNGRWTPGSEPVFVNVTVNNGELDPAIPSLSVSSVTAGESITVRWNTVSNAERYNVYLYGPRYGREHMTTDTQYLLDTTGMASGTYRLEIIPEASGYSAPSLYYEVNIYVHSSEDIPADATMTLPAGLTAIESEAFMGVRARKVVIPSGCVEIGKNAFAFSAVEEVVIPASVTSFGSGIFAGCGDVVIVTPSGSPAEGYARANGYTVKH